MSHNVVCIARASGAGGEEIGRVVADRLGFLYVDEEIIDLAAKRAGIDPDQVADEERGKPLFAGLLDYLADGGGTMLTPPPAAAEIPSEAVRTFIRDAIEEVAARGKAVIVAHAASYAVPGERRPLRVLVTGSRETRSRRLGAAEGLADLEATRVIKNSDAARVDYLKRFYGVAVELPIHYDLVINTDAISMTQAAALIARAASDDL
jgi:Cytidylate kinase-like family